MPRREVILISDFQRDGWSPRRRPPPADGTVLTPVSVAGRRRQNLAVTPVTVQRDSASRTRTASRSPPASSTAVTRLLPTFRSPRARRPRGAEREGQRAGERLGIHTFPPSTLSSPNTRGVVRIGDDGLARDNAFYFVLSPPRPVTVTHRRQCPCLARRDAVSLARARHRRGPPLRGLARAALTT